MFMYNFPLAKDHFSKLYVISGVVIPQIAVCLCSVEAERVPMPVYWFPACQAAVEE